MTNAAKLTQAETDLGTASTDASGRTPTTTYATTDNQLGGKTLTSGVYAFGHGDTNNLTGTLTLDGQGDSREDGQIIKNLTQRIQACQTQDLLLMRIIFHGTSPSLFS